MAQEGPEALVTENHAEDIDHRPLHEQIAALAYALWHERGCPDGSPEEDWLKAEQEIQDQCET